MPALTAKESARYGVRLFGYLLATTLLGGAFVGGGVALAVTMAPDVVPGGPAPSNYGALAGASVLVLVGVLVFVTGLALVLFTVVADGVRAGTGRRSVTPPPSDQETTDTSATQSDEEAKDSPETTKPETTQPTPSVEPASGSDAGDGATDPAESTAADPLGPSTEATEDDREALDPNDPIDDPHAATSNPFGEPEPSREAEEWTGKGESDQPNRRAGPAEDDEAWREEIEAKLDAEDEPPSGGAN